MVPDFSKLGSEKTEDWLRQELLYVDLVGQLPLEKKDFRSICDLIQKRYILGNKVLIKQVSPALFITSMVFTARYSDLNVRNFWTPYVNLVWKKDNISQPLYKEFQDKFKKSITFLEQEFDLVFPQRSYGEVVQPIYRHAIIPFYLQDDFADWIKDRWREILLIPTEDLIKQLRLDNSYRYLPTTLRKFIDGKRTGDTAKELLTTIANAASLFTQGEPLEHIDLLLSPSPIHKSLWNELLKVYQEQDIEVTSKQVEPLFDWVWSLQEHEIQLRIRNMVTQSNEQPDRFVWADRGEAPSDADIDTRILPWQTENGWLIDTSFIGPGPLDGQIALLGEFGSILDAFPVPKLPEDQPIMVFRLTQQNIYGVPVDSSSGLITDGHWLISKANNVKILNERGNELDPFEKLPVPSPLDRKGHHIAGIYNFKLPISFSQNQLQLEIIEKKKQVGCKPFIIGSHFNSIPNLSDAVPPAFNSPDIWMVIHNPPNYLIRRGTLWLQDASSTTMYRLKDLETSGWISIIEGDLRISFRELLQDNLATYSVQIVIGLNPFFAAPLEFAYLPDVTIFSPDPQIIYSPNELPVCVIEGLNIEKLKVRSGTSVKHKNSAVEVIWSDLRDDPQLHIQEGNERVSLSWELQRTMAWISPEKDDYTLDEFRNCEFRVFSTSPFINAFSTWVDDDSPRRDIYLGRNGRYSTTIRNDPVFDLVREKPSPDVRLYIGMGSSQWALGEIHKKVCLDLAEVKVHRTTNKCFMKFSCNLENAWTGDTQYICSPILNLSEKLILEQTTQLTNEHLFECALPNGFYQLQIIHQGQKLLEPPIVFSTVPDIDPETIDLVSLQPFLGKDNCQRPIPHSLHKGFADIVVASYSDDFFLDHPNLLFRILTLPIEVVLKHRKTKLVEESLVISSLLDTLTGKTSKRDDGLMPPWIVMDRPLYLNLILPLKHVIIKIFPQYLEKQASRGIGYTYLRVRGEDKEADPIYVKWDIRAWSNRYDVFLGLPDNTDKRTYPILDELDVWPLKQCKQCGQLIITRRTVKDEYLYEQHKHDKNKPKLVDITYDYDLIARSSISRLQEELFYFEKPSLSVNRTEAIRIAEGHVPRQIIRPNNPISLESYLFSIWRIRERIAKDEAFYVNEWFSVKKWQKGFNHLGQLLVENQVKIPAFGPAYRLMECMKSDNGHRWLDLDKQFLMLALLLRGQAHNQGQILKLLNDIDLGIQDLIEMVEFAREISPELFGWGLAWAETFYSHALC